VDPAVDRSVQGHAIEALVVTAAVHRLHPGLELVTLGEHVVARGLVELIQGARARTRLFLVPFCVGFLFGATGEVEEFEQMPDQVRALPVKGKTEQRFERVARGRRFHASEAGRTHAEGLTLDEKIDTCCLHIVDVGLGDVTTETALGNVSETCELAIDAHIEVLSTKWNEPLGAQFQGWMGQK